MYLNYLKALNKLPLQYTILKKVKRYKKQRKRLWI